MRNIASLYVSIRIHRKWGCFHWKNSGWSTSNLGPAAFRIHPPGSGSIPDASAWGVSIGSGGVSTGKNFFLPHGRITCTAKEISVHPSSTWVRQHSGWSTSNLGPAAFRMVNFQPPPMPVGGSDQYSRFVTVPGWLCALFVVFIGCLVPVREGRRRDTGLSLRDLSFFFVVPPLVCYRTHHYFRGGLNAWPMQTAI